MRKWFPLQRTIALSLMMCGCLLMSSRLQATTTSPPTITLEKAVYFTAPSGDPVTLEPGTYTVEAMEQGLRLTPKDGKAEDTKVIQAQQIPHGESLIEPKMLSESIGDTLRVALFLTDGSGREAIGSHSGVMSRGVEGPSNTAYGSGALRSNTTGNNNTAYGVNALYANGSGLGNTAVGKDVLNRNITGNYSTAIGFRALSSNTASFNTAIGFNALNRNATGDRNIAIGDNVMAVNTTGSRNIAIGSLALYQNFNTHDNIAVGHEALKMNKGSENTAIGSGALLGNSFGGRNTANGFNALRANTSGLANTAVGWNALLALGIGGGNTGIGISTLSTLIDGSRNTAIGGSAGSNLAKGNDNIYINNYQGANEESGTIRIGTHGFNSRAFIAGIINVPVTGVPVVVDTHGQLGIAASSLRYKDDVQNMAEASHGLHQLRPVTFRYKPEIAGDKRTLEFGLIAEEVAEVYPELVGRDADGNIVTVKYHELIPMLLNELQKQYRLSEKQNRRIDDLSARVAELEAAR